MPKRPDAAEDILRQNLKRFREECGLSQTEAADEIGILVESLRRYEQGRRRVDAMLLPKLAECYGRELAHFYLADPPPANPTARPVYFLRMRRGAPVPDQAIHDEIVRLIQAANRRARDAATPAIRPMPRDGKTRTRKRS